MTEMEAPVTVKRKSYEKPVLVRQVILVRILANTTEVVL
jgi:hypothetical protein